MRTLPILALLALAAGCDSASPIAYDAGIDLAPTTDGDAAVHEDPGCGAVDFCLDFIHAGTFAQCALPPPPGSDTNVANAYFQCVTQAASASGACHAVCDVGFTNFDAGTSTRGTCVTCLHQTACVAQAAACGFN